MNKLMTMAFLLVASAANASPLSDHINATLLDHVSVTALLDSGETKVALLDSVIEIGSYKGNYLLGLQAGFAGDTRPESGEAQSVNYLIGATFRLNLLLKDRINLPSHWEFLRALEYGPSYHRDLREKEDIIGFNVGLAFNPNPLQ